MKLVVRLFALLVVMPATYFFVFWVPFSLLSGFFGEYRWMIGSMVSMLCSLAAGWFVWVKLGSAGQGLISSIFTGAVLAGGIGFSAGFFGPIIFTPQANQGPLLGIFITGPLGFIIGGILGFLYWIRRGRQVQTGKN